MALADWVRTERPAQSGTAEIGARRIYILPTRYGLLFVLLLFLMLLGAVNYGNNPAHLLTFLLGALGANAIYLTWRNLRGLQLVCHGAAPVFAGQGAVYTVELRGGERERPAVQLAFADSEPVLADLAAGATRHLELVLDHFPRGEHDPGHLTVSTRYPFGLFRAWCLVECDRPCLVYPAPGGDWQARHSEQGPGEGDGSGDGGDDFAGLRGYRPGDQPAQIDWKSFARDRGLNTRQFSGERLEPLWIDWHEAPGSDTESRLSALCRAVLDRDGAGRRYGLRTPTGAIEPDSGPAHRHRCLRHLALHGFDDA
jgi:uncharacterized protein (DUF58 family)